MFPFSAIVGQERMKRALVLNAVNPRIGGVLVRGEKGTAKSTAVRALATVLPELAVVVGCRYGCDPERRDQLCAECREQEGLGTLAVTERRVPIVNLPVGATEDRVTGTIDIEDAILKGERRFEPGLLAAANRGILYVDEVNLLNDHLVDVLLDAAAMGVNYVEREGISLSHPAGFILVGTMNPEEGDLRPQLLDRFALAVEVEGLADRRQRADVVRRRIAFETDPVAFATAWEQEEAAERERIARARAALPSVVLDDRTLDLIAHLCADFGVDGLRADIVMHKAATTLAAYAGRARVGEEDVRDAAELALPHRRRRQPFQQPGFDREEIERAIDDRLKERDDGSEPSPPADSPETPDADATEPPGPSKDEVFASGEPYAVRPIDPPARRDERPRRPGRRGRSRTQTSSGQYVAARPAGEDVGEVALDATVRAAAPKQAARRAADPDGPALRVRRADLREKVRETRTGNLILFAVDASGSMAARRRMTAAKEAVLSLLVEAYQKRDRVGLIAFRGADAEVLLPPTKSVELAERSLSSLPTGGRTPLAQALRLAHHTFERHATTHPEDVPLLVVVSDGRANVPLGGGGVAAGVAGWAAELRARGVHAVVVDTESGGMRMGLARELSRQLGGPHLPIEQLRAGDLLTAVHQTVGRA